jgi:hypothetical protein
MITPVRKGNVPASTPAVDQLIPLSMLETITAAPKVPVRAAVASSRARREIIDAAAQLTSHPCSAAILRTCSMSSFMNLSKSAPVKKVSVCDVRSMYSFHSGVACTFFISST